MKIIPFQSIEQIEDKIEEIREKYREYYISNPKENSEKAAMSWDLGGRSLGGLFNKYKVDLYNWKKQLPLEKMKIFYQDLLKVEIESK